MRQLALGSVGRRISWMLVVALTLPLLVLATPPRRAYAQLSRVPAVAVLDFGVLGKSKYRDILGRNATDAVVIEMTRSGKYDVAARTLVNQQLQDLSLKLPCTNNDLRRLGSALGVDTVVSGDVIQAFIGTSPRRAQVTLRVQFTDVVSGELVNGTIQSGYSCTPAPGENMDDETLISQALTDAAANVVRTINNYTLPEATILMNNGTETVTLNRGARDGLQTGQEMIVTRGRDRVGKIRVTFVESTTSTATVLDYGKGIRPEDHARAIFKIPGYDVSPEGVITRSTPSTTDYKPTKNKTTPILLTALAIGAAVLLATFLFARKSTTEEATGIGKVQARAFAIGSSANSSDPSASRVQVTWRAATDIAIPSIIEYHIYRDYQIIAVTTRQNTTFIDDPTLAAGTQVTYSTVSYGPGNVGNPQGNNATTTTTTGNTTGNNNTTGGNNGNNNGGNNNGGNNNQGNSLPTPNLQSVTATVTPLTVGVTHRYQITIVYQQVQAVQTTNAGGTTTGGGTGGIGGGNVGGGNVGGGNIGGGTTGTTGNTGTTGGNNTNGIGGGGNGNNGNTIIFRETALRATSGGATPITRPSINGIQNGGTPVDGQSGSAPLNNLSVEFQTTAGADQYVVEFASDPSFKKKVVKGPFFFPAAGTTATTQSFNLVNDFKNVQAGALIFFRVGGRNSVDEPGPTGIDTPNGGDYIYSATPSTFRVVPVPPQAP